MEIIIGRPGTQEEREIDRITNNPQNWIDGKIPAFIEVGRFKSQNVNGGAALGSQEYGVWVRGYVPGRGWVELPPVRGIVRYEPDTINKIGERGAYRSMPPESEAIERQISKIRSLMED